MSTWISPRSPPGNPIDTWLDKREWGPRLWFVLRSLGAGLGPAPSMAAQQHFSAMVHHVVHLLPCESCRTHAVAYLAAHPVACLDGVHALAWLDAFERTVVAQKEDESKQARRAPRSSAVPRRPRRSSVATKRPAKRPTPKRARATVTSKHGSAKAFIKSSNIQDKRLAKTILDGAAKLPFALPQDVSAMPAAQRRALERLARSAKHFNRPCTTC